MGHEDDARCVGRKLGTRGLSSRGDATELDPGSVAFRFRETKLLRARGRQKVQPNRQMTAYCKSCFRDLPSDLAECPRCIGSARGSHGSLVAGILSLAVIATGILSLNARLCIAGAVIGVVALAIHIIRVTMHSG